MLVAILLTPGLSGAHPLHSEAIERPCEISSQADRALRIEGQCGFFIAAGYLVFELQPRPAAGANMQVVSGAINLGQATGSVFHGERGVLADGVVVLADATPEIVHVQPGELAAWDNGIVLSVSGSPASTDASPGPVAQAVGASPAELFTTYLELGFLHIIPRGFDHILFVVGLFLLSPALKPLLWQVSAFTVAHTATLALGTVGLVQLSADIVEPLIALSIIWIAVENLLTHRLHRWRIGVVFGFGLLHGLGFAGVLREIGWSGTHFFSALLAFNVGVELGQLAVIALCFVAVGWAMNSSHYQRRIVAPASSVIACVGAYWVVERLGLL